MHGAEGAGTLQRSLRDVDGGDPSAERRRDHHGGEPDTPTAEHRQFSALTDLAVRGHGAERRRKTASEGRRGERVDALGKRDEVDVGGSDDDILRKGARMGEARLRLIRADVRVAGEAPAASPASVDERGRHAIALPETPNVRTDRRDDAGELVTGDVRQRHRIVPAPGVPVRAADA